MSNSKLASVAGLVVALAAAIGPVAASTAFAADAGADSAITLNVSVGDLNLASEAGARRALSRIQHAADEICTGGIDERTLGEQYQAQTCTKGVVGRTVAEMNLPMLTAVSQGRHVTAMASASH
jgi:UrcA family protein